MKPVAVLSPPAQLALRIVLGLAALDTLAVGLWALLRPDDLFTWLQLPESDGPRDRQQVWAWLGAIDLVYALLLVILIRWPDRLGPLALAPLLGRLIGCGVWLFVIGGGRVELNTDAAWLLVGHDAMWAGVLTAFLVLWWVRIAPPAGRAKRGHEGPIMTLRALAVMLLVSVSASAAESKPQWVVVTAPAFREAMQPLIDHRKEQGFAVSIVPGDAERLRDHVNKLCRDHDGPSFLLLAGAVSGEARTVVPPLKATAGRMKDQPSDNGYGCPDDGLLPSVAVGRFPARSVAECRAMVAKTLAFEKDARPIEWKRRMTVLAGVPAFNPVVDKVVERLAIARFDRIDPTWSGQALYHNPQSPFTVPDELVHERALKMVQDGGAFTLYLGHSNAQGFWAGEARYLDRDDWLRLKMTHPSVLVTFGCNGCQLAGPNGEGYGVWAVRNPDGPVAALGSHGICFAAMVELASSGLFERAFKKDVPERLGEAWLGLKEGIGKGKIDFLTFRLLDAVDGDGAISEADQRREHLEMFVLLGDPALKLPRVPNDVKLSVDDPTAKVLTIRGDAPARLEGAKVKLTLERPVSSDAPDLEPLPNNSAERAKSMLANHERANQFVVVSSDAMIKSGSFEAQLRLPERIPSKRLVIKASLTTATEGGQGVLPLTLPDDK